MLRELSRTNELYAREFSGTRDFMVYQPVNAYIHARDSSNDLALLSTKLPASGFPSFRLNLKHGEQIASYGFPYGNDFASFTMGNVTR